MTRTLIVLSVVVALWYESIVRADQFIAQADITIDEPFELLTQINVVALREASGLAVSRLDSEIMWSHNDSGRGPLLFAFDQSGNHRGAYYLKETVARDWEDMASFNWQGRSWLAIADIGDNASRRPYMQIHLVQEPVLPAKRERRTQRIDVDRSIRFTFPDGPADSESVAIDTESEKIFVLTKRQKPPRLYSLPLNALTSGDEIIEATFEGAIKPLPLPQLQELIDFPTHGIYRSQPTAMDFSAQGNFAIISTYGYSYLYPRRFQQDWSSVLQQQGIKITVPFMKQNEAVAVSADNRNLLYTSEGNKPPLYRLPISKALQQLETADE